MSFQAIVVPEPGPAALRELTDADLPDGDVTVAVSHSSLNYKDGLVVTGTGRVARSYPMVCGIDLAGVVESSDSPDWRTGDEVLVTAGACRRTTRRHTSAARRRSVVDAAAAAFTARAACMADSDPG